MEHISRDTALVLTGFMDDSADGIDENSTYGQGFKFVCRLKEDSNHIVDRYAIDVVVFSSNSDSWTNTFMDVLIQKNVTCTKLN